MSYLNTLQNPRFITGARWVTGANVLSVVAASIAASFTATIPDAGGADTFVFANLAQTVQSKTLGTGTTLGANVAGGGFLVNNLGIPIQPTDSTPKGYDNYPVVVVSTTNLSGTYSGGAKTITASSNVAFPAVDGVTLSAIGQRILVNGQTTPSNNGIYKLTTVGSGATPWVLTRDVDFNSTALIDIPSFVQVGQGTANAGTAWWWSNVSAVLDTTSILFAQWTTVLPLTTLGDLLYENATPAPARLAGNTTATKQFLTQTGTGSVSAAPIWAVIASTDLPLVQMNILQKSANYSRANADQVVQYTTGTSTLVDTLPIPSSSNKGVFYFTQKLDSATGKITVTPGAGNINGGANYTVDLQFDNLGSFNDGVNYWTI